MRAIAVPEVDHVAVEVGQDLDLDVPRVLDVLFEVHARVAEGGLGLGARPAARPMFSARSFIATRIPRPPPPAAALTRTGKPIRGPAAGLRPRRRPARRCPAPWAPWPARATGLAEFLSPSMAIASCEGPMNSMLQLRQTSAKWAFSVRKP